MVTYRVSSSSKEQYWNLGEIKLTNKGKPVKIDPKSCSSSSAIGNNGCQRLFDQNVGTYWSPDYAKKRANSRGYWVEFKAGPADSISIYQYAHEHSYAALTINGGKPQKLPLVRKNRSWSTIKIGTAPPPTTTTPKKTTTTTPKKTPSPTGMVTYRVSSSSKEQYWNLGEIKLTNKGKPVKIDPKSCSSSSVIGNNGCQRLFDGNVGTYWSPDYANKQANSRDYWIEFKAGPADSISIFQSGHEHSYAALTINGDKPQKLPLIRKNRSWSTIKIV